jgi:methyltransferase (TIGR00027 family)
VARTDDDAWDLATSVGATATMVAAARAAATADPDPLIDDPYAEPLVRAVGIDFFTKMLDGELDLSQLPDSSPERAKAMIDGMAVRTKFFDDCCTAAAAAGVAQVVILASGLDARAYRLPWPADTVVYELDQPAVIDFKTRTLGDLGVKPTAIHRPVPIDLRDDWPAALHEAGFDAAQPTAWLAEGLLVYLPPDGQDRLLDQITALSAPRSTITTEFAPGIVDFDPEQVRARTQPMRDLGLDIDMPSLVYAGARTPVMDYLADRGWQVTQASRSELFTRYGRTPVSRPDNTDPLGEIVYVSARLNQ